MKNMSLGERVKLIDFLDQSILNKRLFIEIVGEEELDITCFGLDSEEKLSDDRYMIFYNQLVSPNSEILSNLTNPKKSIFEIDLNRLPANIKKLVFTLTLDSNKEIRNIKPIKLNIGNGIETSIQFVVKGEDFRNEKAIILAEVYFKDLWRLNAVAKGFDGGLSALLKHFGGEEIVDIIDEKKVNLEKKMREKAPILVDLTKKASISLEKVGLKAHRAKVALCLDISGSMDSLYRKGLVKKLSEKILALGCNFDDDGEIDVFLFGIDAHIPEPYSIDNCGNYLNEILKEYPLEGGTDYGKVIKKIREYYEDSTEGLPIYVMFVTDGETSSEDQARDQIRKASYEPIFWQFMAIGEGRFRFLEELDTLTGRLIDNAGFFKVSSPDSISDEELYDQLMSEYPDWIKHAKNKKLIF